MSNQLRMALELGPQEILRLHQGSNQFVKEINAKVIQPHQAGLQLRKFLITMPAFSLMCKGIYKLTLALVPSLNDRDREKLNKATMYPPIEIRQHFGGMTVVAISSLEMAKGKEGGLLVSLVLFTPRFPLSIPLARYAQYRQPLCLPLHLFMKTMTFLRCCQALKAMLVLWLPLTVRTPCQLLGCPHHQRNTLS
jgi:hypothetical protein